GQYLTEATLCFAISAYQAMLPAAMKAKYEKEIRLVSETYRMHLHPSVQPFFAERSSISWKEIEHTNVLSRLQKDIQNGYLEVVY
ncbi:hypothetical protein RO468_20310, partial [Aeromonas enteropelogenes]